MTTPIFTVDAFTDQAFSGNPAAICLLDEPASESWMQSVAREMNLSETAFLTPPGAQGAYGLRWFTPGAEVALCGHATLASSHVLWTEGRARDDTPIRFQTLSGELTARRADDGWIELDFPSLPARPWDTDAELAAALGVAPRQVLRSRMDLLCVMDSEQTVRALVPDGARLGRLPGVRGVIVTAVAANSDTRYDFVSRFFAPSVSVAEDPVTGSAHCVLAPFWAERLGRSQLTGYQASARGGLVRVVVAGDRVRLFGQAVTVLRGKLAV